MSRASRARRRPNPAPRKPGSAVATRPKAEVVLPTNVQTTHPPVFAQTYGEPAAERVLTSYEQYVELAYGGSAIVFGLLNTLMRLFAEARFCWRSLDDKKLTYKLAAEDLERLRNPWPNGFTGDMLSRMMQDASIAGNAYVRRAGSRLERLRPDWVTIVSWVTDDESGHQVREVIGYMYDPTGDPGRAPDWYPVEDVCAWAPIPDPMANFRGMSWFTPAIKEINADKAMTEHREKFWRNSATPNIIIKYSGRITPQQKIGLAESIAAKHGGPDKAGGTLVLDEGADPLIVGSKFSDAQFQEILAMTENRMAVAAGVPALLAGIKEGLDAAAWSMYKQAIRAFADIRVRPDWRSVCSALSVLVDEPDGYELWYDTRDIAALQESEAESAGRMQTTISTIAAAIQAGFKPQSAVDAVSAGDETLLVHSGLVSVQLLPPGPQVDPNAAPATDPSTPDGDGTPADPAVAEDDVNRALVELLGGQLERSQLADGALVDRLLDIVERSLTDDTFEREGHLIKVRRDDEGQFASKGGGPLDKLKLAGRIVLNAGERLLASDKVSSDRDDGRAWLAVTELDGQRSLRLGLGNAMFGSRDDEGGRWSAAPDRSAEINQSRTALRRERDELDSRIDDLTKDPGTDQAELAQAKARLDELDDMDLGEMFANGHTALLDVAAVKQLSLALAAALAEGQRLQAEMDSKYQRRDDLEAQRDGLRGMSRKWTDEEDARWDRLTAEIEALGPEIEIARPDLGYWVLAEGSVPGQWADVHYEVYLDDLDIGVETHIGAVPHGSGMTLEDLQDGEMYASLGVSGAQKLAQLLADLSSGTADASRSRISRARTKAEFAKLVAANKVKRDGEGQFAHTASSAVKKAASVAKALLTGEPGALDGFNREQLRREAKKRNIDLPRGAHEDVIKDALWEHEHEGVDDEADLPEAGKAELDLTRLKVPELREKAKAAGVKGYSKMRKAELVAALGPAKPAADDENVLPEADEDLSPDELRERAEMRAFTVQSAIREAYQAKKPQDADWISLKDLRGELSRRGFSDRAEQDEQLKALVARGAIRLIPEENQRALSADDAAAAISISGEMKHVIGPNDDFLRRQERRFQGDVRTGRTRSRRKTDAETPAAETAGQEMAPKQADLEAKWAASRAEHARYDRARLIGGQIAHIMQALNDDEGPEHRETFVGQYLEHAARVTKDPGEAAMLRDWSKQALATGSNDAAMMLLRDRAREQGIDIVGMPDDEVKFKRGEFTELVPGAHGPEGQAWIMRPGVRDIPSGKVVEKPMVWDLEPEPRTRGWHAAPVREESGGPKEAPPKGSAVRTPEQMIADPQPEDRELLRDFLRGMTLAELKKWAKDHGLTLSNFGTKPDRIDSLVEGAIGFKINSVAIREGVKAEPGETRYGQPDAAGPKRPAAGGFEASHGGVAATEILGDEHNYSHVELVTFADGSRYVLKKPKRNQQGMSATLKSEHDSEELAAKVAEALGLRPPRVHRDSSDEAYFDYIDTGTIAAEAGVRSSADIPDAQLMTPDGYRMGLLDILTENGDRSPTNWFVGDDGSLVPIDHGLTWADFGFAKTDPTKAKYPGSKFEYHYAFPGGAGGGEWHDNDLSPSYIKDLTQRLSDLKREFDRLGRTDDHQRMMSLLAVIAKHAKGQMVL